MTEDILAKLPALPDSATFKPIKVEKVTLPHLFMITPRHLTGDSMYLNEDAIERSGAPCGMKGCNLGVREHETLLTLFVEVPDNKINLNDISGLGPWLQSVKDAELGLDGFAFPNKL